MPSDQDMQGSELDLTVTPENESGDDTRTTEGEGESDASAKLDLTEESQVDKLSPAEKNRRDQLEAWSKKLDQLDQAPAWIQKELSAPNKANVEEVVQQALAKEREEQEFKTLQSELPTLTQSQANELQERFKALRGAGKVVALKAAMDAMGLSKKVQEAEQRGVLKGRMSLPKSGQPSVKQSEPAHGGVPLSVITDEKKWAAMIREGTQE